jgi:hypothetical protein
MAQGSAGEIMLATGTQSVKDAFNKLTRSDES